MSSLLLKAFSVSASIQYYYPFQVEPSASNYGITGLMEIPNARFMKEASLRLNYSSSFPNEYTSITASPFEWLEASYRYTEIKNKRYGPASYAGNQTLKDKGFDLKVRLFKETSSMPSIAIGLRDIAGTGLFSSEYIVSSKKYNNFDFTVGLGWGALGSAGGIGNPFQSLSDKFNQRTDEDYGQGGNFSFNKWFSGKTSILGGIEYEIPLKGLRMKLEYDTSEPDSLGSVKKVNSRFNYGFNFSYSSNLNLSASYERGSTYRFAFKLKGNFFKDTINKPKPKTVQRLNEEQKESILKNNQIFYRSLNLSLRDESIYIQAANLDNSEVDIAIASSRFYSMTRPVGRTLRIASALSPDSIEKINIHAMNGDFEVAKLSFSREEFEKANADKISEVELLKKTVIQSDSAAPLYKKASFMPTVNFPEFDWSMSPALKHQIGGPEGFYLGQLFWKTDTSIKFRRNLTLYSSFGINLYDTFNDFNNRSSSTIPHVRSDIQDYLSEGKNNIQRMQLEYFSSPFKDIFFRADFGLLEEMFAGVGGEILYRPFEKPYSFGLTLHKVRQRDYDQLFSLRKYSTVTGHLGFYADLPRQIQAQILMGKYLARDKGVTLDLSRRFNSGFTLGVFATKTNLSAEEFGEGSFDKGFYISVPTQLFYSDFRSGNISFGLHPLTKDGGAILNHHNSLISILGDSSEGSFRRDWEYLLK